MRPSLSERLASLAPNALSPEHAGIVDSCNSASEPLSDEVADLLPSGLQQALSPEPLRQTHRLEGARIYTVTYVLLPGIDAGALKAALVDEEWSWWKNGRISKWSKGDEGGCRFVLAPVWPLVPSRVGIELQPPTSSEESTPWGAPIPVTTFAAAFFADFEGPGRYEILSLDGGCALRSVWDGVARLGFKKLMPLSIILNMHLGAEAGTLPFPLPKGTGFPGLVERLNSQAQS